MPKTTPTVMLYFVRIVRHEVTRSSGDRRRKVNRVTCEYRGSDGEEYRKVFESRPNTWPTMPTSGTHAEVNAAKFQL